MTPAVKPPSRKLLRACDVLDALVGTIATAIAKPRQDFVKWEASVEGLLLLHQVIRHTEAVIALARVDLVLLPAAFVLARAAFETGVRVRWVLFPEPKFDREARWLVHLEEEERLWTRLASLAQKSGAPVPTYGANEASIKAFRLAVTKRLPSGTVMPPGIPSLPVALKEQNDERRYITYALLSQFVHGGHYAGTTWRRGLGTLKEFGEHTPESQWAMTLRITWWSLFQSAARFVSIACEPETILADTERISSLERLLDNLERASGTAAQQSAAPDGRTLH